MEIKIIFLVIAALFWIVKKIVGFNKDTKYKGKTSQDLAEETSHETFESILQQFAVENREMAREQNKYSKPTVVTEEDKIENAAFSKFQGTNPIKLNVEPVKRRNTHYQIKKRKKNPYAMMFKDPKDVKKAFIGHLIFDRKKY